MLSAASLAPPKAIAEEDVTLNRNLAVEAEKEGARVHRVECVGIGFDGRFLLAVDTRSPLADEIVKLRVPLYVRPVLGWRCEEVARRCFAGVVQISDYERNISWTNSRFPNAVFFRTHISQVERPDCRATRPDASPPPL
jgi:hypothetical protein